MRRKCFLLSEKVLFTSNNLCQTDNFICIVMPQNRCDLIFLYLKNTKWTKLREKSQVGFCHCLLCTFLSSNIFYSSKTIQVIKKKSVLHHSHEDYDTQSWCKSDIWLINLISHGKWCVGPIRGYHTYYGWWHLMVCRQTEAPLASSDGKLTN